jgi:beta-1,4-mannosyl-glycoprotein beta-1,4-N-acetylglucosaminyltransferase
MKKNIPEIYDCFMLFNEVELLKIRLGELYEFVDYFVIVEAKTSYSGERKPLYYLKHKNELKKFRDKIIYIPVKHPKFNFIDKLYIWLNKKYRKNFIIVAGFLFGIGTNWKMEVFQRTQMRKGLINCRPDDIVIVSDIDEIPNIKIFSEVRKKCKENKLVWLRQKDYRYFLNGQLKSPWLGTKAITFKNLNKYYHGNPASIRYGLTFAFRKRFKLNPEISFVDDGGWHFSYLGGFKKVMEKIKYFASMDLYLSKTNDSKITNEKNIKECVNKGIIVWDKNQKMKYVPIDKTFPRTIYKNKKKYSHLIYKQKKNNS